MNHIEAIKITNTMLKNMPLGMTIKDIDKYIKEKKIEKYWNKTRKKIFDEGLKILKENNYNFIDLNRTIKSNYGKYGRIQKRIKKMIKNKCWFCTYTIEDKYMNKDHIRKLRDINKGKNYIINVDYGTKTERKHYHGIIESEEEPKKWEYGYCKMIEIITTDTTSKQISKYINKLTAHTLKEGTKQEKIIYSRVRAKK